MNDKLKIYIESLEKDLFASKKRYEHEIKHFGISSVSAYYDGKCAALQGVILTLKEIS